MFRAKTTYFFVGLLTVATAFAAERSEGAGGSLGGNGAGLVEQNAAYAYRALPRAISQCLNLPRQCKLTAHQTEVLRKIQETVVAEIQKASQKLQYKSAKENPGFFDTAANQHHRLSRTDLTTDAPIFFNTDQLYAADGQPAVDIPALTAILIHEFGHQAKFEDHEELNAIAAEVRLLLAQQISTREYPSENVSMTVVNYQTGGVPMDVILKVGDQVRSLTHLIIRGARCKAGADAHIVGWKLFNDRWELASRTRENGVDRDVYPYLGWLQLDCVKGSTLYSELHEVELRASIVPSEAGKAAFYVGGKAYFRTLR